MICAVIKGPTYEEAHQQLSQALPCADLVELRLDCFHSLDLDAIKKLQFEFTMPMIFTLRKHSQGGNYIQSETARLHDLHRLLELKPEYLDVESDTSPQWLKEHSLFQTKLILSYHNFDNTPHDLDAIYSDMQKTPAHFYKIAVTAHHATDALRLMCWKKTKDQCLIAISMGPHGQISRILAPVIGCPITYAALTDDQQSAPGQLPADILINQFNYRNLNANTAIFALIGNPIQKSMSDQIHNAIFTTCGFNAVYVKIHVETEELADFISYAKTLPFTGMSVTMPLKEHILKFLDEIDPKITEVGAVNTLLFKENTLFGCNTDGIGALNVLETTCPVNHKHIVILGAGGAAKAIAHEALLRGAFVTLLNRNTEKAKQLAHQLNCKAGGLEQIESCTKEGYDILINCTPAPLPIDPQHILPHSTVMDIVQHPKETLFLQHAQIKECKIIYGYQMFIQQAIGQYVLWFNQTFDPQLLAIELKNKIESLFQLRKNTKCLKENP